MEIRLINKLKLDKFDNKSIIKNSKEKANSFDGYEFIKTKDSKLNLAIAFVYTLEEMKDVVNSTYKNDLLEENGLLYLAYPKTKNKLKYPYIHLDDIFPYLEVNEDDGYIKNTSYKFNRMVSLDENYTIISAKYEIKKEGKNKNTVSNYVDDYIEFIDNIEIYLIEYPDELEFYKNLSPGYRKDWARYVYSAKTDTTINKRLNEMKDILGQGYKTKQHFRDNKK